MLWKSSIGLFRTLIVSILFAATPFIGVPIFRSESAASIAYPDLQMMIPTSDISIGQPTPSTRELRFSHVTWNAGPGPMEIDPAYDPATGTAQGYQRLYTYNQSQQLVPVEDIPIVGPMVFVPPRQYNFPMASFTLYTAASDGSIGEPVAASPKTAFCIGDDYYVGGVANTASGAAYVHCSDPSDTIGLSVGYGDEYDYLDTGENIDITNLPDGIYWLRAIANPDHYLVETDTRNDATDTELSIYGDTVTVLAQNHPDSTPPSVTLETPSSGASLTGPVTLTATASAPTGVKSVQFLLDGRPLGPPLTSAPYGYNWNTSQASAGAHLLSVQATSANGFIGTAPPTSITVTRQVGKFTVEQELISDGVGTVQTPSFSSSNDNALLLAFAATSVTGVSQPISVSGAGLTWTRVAQANGQAGDSEIWVATAPGPLDEVTVTSVEDKPEFTQSLVVLVLKGAAGIGARSFASAPSGAPTVSLTTTSPDSWILGIGNDWTAPLGRTVGLNQQLIHQWLDGAGSNTYWMQSTSTTIAGSGTSVTLDDGAPTSDQWNFAAVEVRSVENTTTPTPIATLAPTLTPAPISTSTPGATNTPVTTVFLPLLADGSSLQSSAAHQTTASIINPVAEENLSGSVIVAAQTLDTRSVEGVQFLLDGQPLGTQITTAPFAMTWNTGQSSNGTHIVSARTTGFDGETSQSPPISVNVTNPRPPMTCFTVDASVSTDGSGTLSTPAFHTALPQELIVAFVAGDGPNGTPQSFSVNGAGLHWTLAKRSNGPPGTAEIWVATANHALANATVTAIPLISGYDGSLHVIAFQEAGGFGAVRALSAATGAPAVTLNTTKDQSVIYGVGIDSSQAVPITVDKNQILDHQWVDPAAQATYWVQNWTSATGPAGTRVTLNDILPRNDRWNFVSVEIVSSEQ